MYNPSFCVSTVDSWGSVSRGGWGSGESIGHTSGLFTSETRELGHPSTSTHQSLVRLLSRVTILWKYQFSLHMNRACLVGSKKPTGTGTGIYNKQSWACRIECQRAMRGPSAASAGLPWWYSGWESTCPYRGHQFNSWSGKIPRAMERLSRCSATTEARAP